MTLSPPAARRYRALSLDLWFTTCWSDAGQEERAAEVRLRTLADLLKDPRGDRFPLHRIREVVEKVRAEARLEGRPIHVIEPRDYLERVARRLDARLAEPIEVASARFSDAGLDEHPPQVNREAVELIRELDQRDVPVVLTTNTVRRGESWKKFLRRSAGIALYDVISSAEVGVGKPDAKIFEWTASSLRVPAAEILHAGDSWELDVTGALSVGLGAALYRGLWPRYPSPLRRPSSGTGTTVGTTSSEWTTSGNSRRSSRRLVER